jgi:predicted RNA-binding protein with PIN domain
LGDRLGREGGGSCTDTVLIDARNVQRSQWPNLSDEELVERARTWAERNGKQIVLVFDGKAPGGVVGATELDERTTLVGSTGESADDWLIREAPHYPGAWLVTSDRALRAAAGGQAERLIGGGGFLRELAGE